MLKELYEHFFRTAARKDAERLGIVYTPTEVVDFILHSADHVLREEFGRGISDEGVHVLDPFTGTGIFPARLLQLDLIDDGDLRRKYSRELHANEIVLLAYYIAAVNVEEAYRSRLGEDAPHESFAGIILTDTFNLQLDRTTFPADWLPGNSERTRKQQKRPIQVIVGNPPWSAGQRSSADDNPNVAYPELAGRVAETYAARSTATLKNSLYDSYKMAIRWASDRIREEGVIALVTNGSWIGGNVDSGVRACLAEEFTSVWVLNLRGNQRTQGERSRREGGKVFGQSSRAPVAITILVKNPAATEGASDGCRIMYCDVGDYLTRDDKLAFLREAGSVAGVDWRRIAPDSHHDWVGQRDPAFQQFVAMGTKEAKAGKADDAVFKLFSNGYKTSRDAYTYNFSRQVCQKNARAMVGDYMGAMQLREARPQETLDDVARAYSSNVRWDRELKNNLRRGRATTYSSARVSRVQYRPFVKQNCYVDYLLVSSKGQLDRIFPDKNTENRAICVPGMGSTKPFSAMVVDTMPDLEVISKGQFFPRYCYERRRRDGQRSLLGEDAALTRIDNISTTAVRAFRVHYQDPTITEDDVFHYIYGVLHGKDYRARFANDLAKAMPRVPYAPDFRAFVAAGKALEALHLGYETCPEFPLQEVAAGSSSGGPLDPARYRIGQKKMRFADDGATLVVNDHVLLTGIPPAAHRYQVNGRTPLEWFIDRYHVKRDRRSGIVNDPNGWFDDPRDLIAAIRRIVHVSVETVRIVDGLPSVLDGSA